MTITRAADAVGALQSLRFALDEGLVNTAALARLGNDLGNLDVTGEQLRRMLRDSVTRAIELIHGTAEHPGSRVTGYTAGHGTTLAAHGAGVDVYLDLDLDDGRRIATVLDDLDRVREIATALLEQIPAVAAHRLGNPCPAGRHGEYRT